LCLLTKIKEREAKEASKLKIKQIEMQKKEMQKAAKSQIPSAYQGMPSQSSYSNYSSKPAPIIQDAVQPTTTSYTPGRGMQLGKKEKTQDFMSLLKDETGIEDVPVASQAPISTSNQSSPVVASPVYADPVVVSIEEKLIVLAHRDGGIENMEVKGELNLRIDDSVKTPLQLNISTTNDKAFQFKTNPIVDKKMFLSDSVIAFKDPSRSLPVNQIIGLLKWRFVTQDESFVPLSSMTLSVELFSKLLAIIYRI
jgi:hypothetical protein